MEVHISLDASILNLGETFIQCLICLLEFWILLVTSFFW